MWVTASPHLDACVMCPQARSPSCGPHPPARDEVGGDDLTLGENHVSAVQEGEGGWLPARPLGFPAPPLSLPAPCQNLPLPDPLPPKATLAPVQAGAWDLPTEAGDAGLAVVTLASPAGQDAVPERHPLSPAGTVLASVVRGPRVSEEQPQHL